MLDEAEVYAQLYGVVITLSDEEASDILDRLSAVKNGQTTVKFRVDSTQDAHLFAQNGFALDLSKGLGNHAELATQRASRQARRRRVRGAAPLGAERLREELPLAA